MMRSQNTPQHSLVNLEPSDSCGVGFIASLKNGPSNEVLQRGLNSLANVSHRGAVGSDGKTGDGAGVTTSIPQKLVTKWLRELRVAKSAAEIGIGMFFVPRECDDQHSFQELVRQQATTLGMRTLGFRQVPVNVEALGTLASETMPKIVQAFFDCAHEDLDQFERELFLLRRSIELSPKPIGLEELYIASASCRTLSYKAMVHSSKLAEFYLDLQQLEFECTTCIFHQRFSTNTAPQWSLCQPFRMLAHNGEINTIRGNRNWMTAREASFDHPFWKLHHRLIKRIFSFNDSDSASLDNAIELLTLSGRSLIHSIAMLIPPAWGNDPRIPKPVKDFYEYHGCFSEPWDGPAAVALTDGKYIAAKLDRNGLRPARYKITQDGMIIVGSEVGPDEVAEGRVIEKGRLAPGEMIAVDIASGTVLTNTQINNQLAAQQPYGDWLSENRHIYADGHIKIDHKFDNVESDDFHRKQIAAGLTREEIEIGLTRMAETAAEPTFSMGVDTPLAVLSKQTRPLTDFFKQRFAQVTNPPIDPIREKLVMSLAAGLGPERNLLSESPYHCRILGLENPILLPGQIEDVQDKITFEFETFSTVWKSNSGVAGMRSALRKIIFDCQLAIERGVTVLILDDEIDDSEFVALPMLMVVGALHHALCQSGQRLMCSIICKTSQVRDSHQLALLFGYGATAVYPYLAYQTIERRRRQQKLSGQPETLMKNFREGLSKGMLKIMSKMGISILNSYQGAQIFEAVGVGPELIETCFKYSYSNIGGITFEDVADDCLSNHRDAYQTPGDELKLHDPGFIKPKRSGEHHVINGKVTKNLHQFVRDENDDGFNEFSNLVKPDEPAAIRDLFSINPLSSETVKLDQVEPIEKIRTRFTTAAMSLGAISPESHEAIAIAMNAIGGKSNSGEGGEDPIRFQSREREQANSKIKQIASGRFGVNAEYLSHAEEIEIKMAQGAKPGEGGQLPGFKVNGLIAKLRNTEPGVTLISPPPHHDIYSIEDLSQLICDLKTINPRARVCVKLVAKTGVGGIAVGCAKANADAILISGHEGGTGASPLTSIKHAGIPWELGLSETHQSLVASNLRDRVVLRTDGGIRTGRDIILAAILGAEEYNFGTMALIALGCVYVKKCHLNNCPVGIATQDPKFRAKFKGKPENLINYLNAVAEQCRSLLASLNATTIDEIVGRTDLLNFLPADNDSRLKQIDLTKLLTPPPEQWSHISTQKKYARGAKTQKAFDDILLQEYSTTGQTEFTRQVGNTDRNIGTRISGFLAQQHLNEANENWNLDLTGTAGQSLGAFLTDGIRIKLAGEANDYVGKGMSGGEIIIQHHPDFQSKAKEAVIAGNTICYGATGGKLFAAGIVAERLCVRNSGATVVVEGCGDHGCEYMTRGTVVVLGTFGNNFAAGMTGGQAFLYDPENTIQDLCNLQTVDVCELTQTDEAELHELILDFANTTQSPKADRILKAWNESKTHFQLIRPKVVEAGVKNELDSQHQTSDQLKA